MAEAITRVYKIVEGKVGRHSGERRQIQYTVTIPPAIARPFVKRFGNRVRFEPREEGILIIPLAPEWS